MVMPAIERTVSSRVMALSRTRMSVIASPMAQARELSMASVRRLTARRQPFAPGLRGR
jgi:hypothetical protein